MRFGKVGLALLSLTVATPVAAREVTVRVDAMAGPWSAEANAQLMPFGVGDAKPATVVPFDVGGGKIAIYATGTTNVPRAEPVPPSGIEGDAADDKLHKKKRYPSFYTPKILYPSNRPALVGAFVDDKAVVVVRPSVVGDGVRVPIPEGATAISLGFNDAVSSGNTGALSVTLDIPD